MKYSSVLLWSFLALMPSLSAQRVRASGIGNSAAETDSSPRSGSSRGMKVPSD